MAEDGQTSPEKQLLKLIEEAKGGDALKAARARKRRGFLAPGALWGVLLGRLAFLRRSAAKPAGKPLRRKWSLNLAVLNRILAVAAVALFAYVAWDLAVSLSGLNAPPEIAVDDGKSAGAAGTIESPLREPGYYLRWVTGRDVFRDETAPVKKKERKKEEGEKKPAALVKEERPVAVADFALVGISWSADPDAIIEDKSTRRTHFVKSGQPLGRGVRVQKIFKDRVILSYEGEEFELR
jgi:hypothetical protein